MYRGDRPAGQDAEEAQASRRAFSRQLDRGLAVKGICGKTSHVVEREASMMVEAFAQIDKEEIDLILSITTKAA
jgi:hypothetical protein